MPFGNRKKNIIEDLFSSALSQFQKYYSSGNLKFNNLGIFQSLKLRISVGKNLSISLMVNFTPNTLGCYGLMREIHCNRESKKCSERRVYFARDPVG